jgi:hypothetical protein
MNEFNARMVEIEEVVPELVWRALLRQLKTQPKRFATASEGRGFQAIPGITLAESQVRALAPGGRLSLNVYGEDSVRIRNPACRSTYAHLQLIDPSSSPEIRFLLSAELAPVQTCTKACRSPCQCSQAGPARWLLGSTPRLSLSRCYRRLR